MAGKSNNIKGNNTHKSMVVTNRNLFGGTGKTKKLTEE